jgi:hypothetical protein
MQSEKWAATILAAAGRVRNANTAAVKSLGEEERLPSKVTCEITFNATFPA